MAGAKLRHCSDCLKKGKNLQKMLGHVLSLLNSRSSFFFLLFFFLVEYFRSYLYCLPAKAVVFRAPSNWGGRAHTKILSGLEKSLNQEISFHDEDDMQGFKVCVCCKPEKGQYLRLTHICLTLLMGWRKNVNLTSPATWKLWVFGFLGFPLMLGVQVLLLLRHMCPDCSQHVSTLPSHSTPRFAPGSCPSHLLVVSNAPCPRKAEQAQLDPACGTAVTWEHRQQGPASSSVLPSSCAHHRFLEDTVTLLALQRKGPGFGAACLHVTCCSPTLQ